VHVQEKVNYPYYPVLYMQCMLKSILMPCVFYDVIKGLLMTAAFKKSFIKVVSSWGAWKVSASWMTSCLENLLMLGHLIAVTEMSWKNLITENCLRLTSRSWLRQRLVDCC